MTWEDLIMAKTVKKITILGGGNGGFAAAADLVLRGYEVTLYEDPKFAASIAGIRDTGVINLEGVGPVGAAKLKKVTTDLAEALEDTDLVMPISPAFAQEAVAKSLVPHVREGMIIFLVPGSCGGGLVYGKVFHDAGVFQKVKICEVNTLPYAARKVNENTVKILMRDPVIWFAAFPAKYNEELLALVKPLFDSITPMKDVLECALNNGNIDSHPAPVVLNAGKIEYYHKHFHYKEGITPSVAKVVWKVNEERMALCEALGYEKINILDRLYITGYCPKSDDLYKAYQGSIGIFMDIEGPNDLSGRYLTEDAPCSLVFCANLGKALGVKTPIMDSIANLASALRSEDYWVTGRTLDKVGLDGMTGEQMKQFVMEGYKD